VSASTAVVATVSALVLGLLISNANASFSRLAQFIRDDDGRLRCARHSGRVDGGGCGEV